jgi:hypothetical protein
MVGHLAASLMAVFLIACLLVTGCTSAAVPEESQPPDEEPTSTETTEPAAPEPPPNPVATYCESLELPEAFVALLAPLGDDGDMSANDQQISDVAKTIAELDIPDDAKTKTITYVASGKAQEYLDACDHLKSVSDTVLADYLMMGIDEDIVDYLTFLDTLADSEFAQKALKNRLCIYDGVLDDLERQFLADPENAEYASQLANHLIQQMETIEPEFTSEMVNNVPEFKIVDANLVCVAEKLAWVVENGKDVDVFGTTFDSMLQEGIPGKRLMFTPGQCIAWVFALEDGMTPVYLEREQPQKEY